MLETLHFYFTLPLVEQLMLDLLVPPFFVLFCWGGDTFKAYFYNAPIYKDSPKWLIFLLGASYMIMIGLTIYFHIFR